MLTAGISFLAVLLIPDGVRLKDYSDNRIGGLAMNVIGPPIARLLLNGFVVGVGFLILAGAVNTAIIGSNGVLNRVAEDGVLSDWFLKPHAQHGTTYRLLYLIVGLQLIAIVISRGDVLVLGEACALGVVWSFVFKAVASTPTEHVEQFNQESVPDHGVIQHLLHPCGKASFHQTLPSGESFPERLVAKVGCDEQGQQEQ